MLIDSLPPWLSVKKPPRPVIASFEVPATGGENKKVGRVLGCLERKLPVV